MTDLFRYFRVFLTPIIIIFVMLGHPAAPSLAAPLCSGRPIMFAHCNDSARNYRSVLIVIHGWNGDCKSTFGKNNKSLFKVIEQQFFDIDCFQYDSLNLSIDVNVRKFGERLKFLHAKGYRQVMLVTHSTGGIIALRYLTRQFLDSNGIASEAQTRPIHSDDNNGLQIEAIHAWATPINGTRTLSGFIGGIAQVIFSPETIKDLKQDSPFLSELKTDMARLRSLMDQRPAERARLKIPITFYQGQSSDGIVESIKDTEVRNADWWPYKAGIVNTASGHTQNIGRNGRIGLPRYPAEITKLGALIELSLTPRLDTVFPKNNTSDPGILEVRQLGIIRGIANYAEYNFFDAYEPLTDFLKRIVTDSFPRNPRVDIAIAKTLAISVEDELLGLLEPRHVTFFDKLVKYIFGDIEIRGDHDLTRFVEESSTAALHIIKMLESIRKNVNRYLDDNPVAMAALLSSGSRGKFNSNILKVQLQMLNFDSGPVQNAALKVFEKSISEYSPAEIKLANFSKSFNAYSKANYFKFNEDNQNSIAKIYGDILGKGSPLSEPTYTHLNQPVDKDGTKRPLWTALLNDKAVKEILNNTVARMGTPTTPEFNFISGVIAQTGPYGNNLATSKLAVTKAQEMLMIAPAEQQKFDWIQKLTESGNASRYRSIQTKVNKAIAKSIM